jgi:hypothetical protein
MAKIRLMTANNTAQAFHRHLVRNNFVIPVEPENIEYMV